MLPTKISNIAQSSPGVAATCVTYAMASVRRSNVARHNRRLGRADMRATLLPTRGSHYRQSYLNSSFSCSCFPTCFTSLAWRRPWNVRDLMFSTCKKRRWRFRKRRFGVHLFTVRYSIRFVYQAWLSWIALLSHCKVTADEVSRKGVVSVMDQWQP